MKKKIMAGEIEVPYKRNHYSKGPSYPETYFINVFNSADIGIEYNLQVGLYQLDFANPSTKKYIEIDGEQHYVDNRIVEHDIKRTKNLEDLGWTLVRRIRWSEFQKLTVPEREIVCNKLIEQLS